MGPCLGRRFVTLKQFFGWCFVKGLIWNYWIELPELANRIRRIISQYGFDNPKTIETDWMLGCCMCRKDWLDAAEGEDGSRIPTPNWDLHNATNEITGRGSKTLYQPQLRPKLTSPQKHVLNPLIKWPQNVHQPLQSAVASLPVLYVVKGKKDISFFNLVFGNPSLIFFGLKNSGKYWDGFINSLRIFMVHGGSHFLHWILNINVQSYFCTHMVDWNYPMMLSKLSLDKSSMIRVALPDSSLARRDIFTSCEVCGGASQKNIKQHQEVAICSR